MVNSEYGYEDSFEKIPYHILTHNNGTSSPATPKTVENLELDLKHFGNDNCLIAINNFLEADIQINNQVPVILRQFGLVILHSEIQSFPSSDSDLIWAPKEHLALIDGNYMVNDDYDIILNCHISKYFAPLGIRNSRHGYCVGLNPTKFSSASKPWSCEVQIDLFMPKKLFDAGKHTHIFRSGVLQSISSSMPKLNIMVDTITLLKEYDPIAVANRMSREKNTNFGMADDTSDFEPATDRMLFGNARCVKKGTIESTNCKVTSFDILLPCMDCPNEYLQEQLSVKDICIDFIRFVDKAKKQLAVPGILADDKVLSKFNLDEQILYFIKSEPFAIQLPLQNLNRMRIKYPDKIQLLAFAYATLFKHLLGISIRSKNQFSTGKYCQESLRSLRDIK